MIVWASAALSLVEHKKETEMIRSIAKLGLPLAVVLATGCTTMGTGTGSTATGGNPVNFTWKSSDGTSGTMNAVTSDGKTYTGRFFQITSDTTVDNLGPLWEGWGPGFRRGGWGYWDAGPEFVTHYSGKVVANLTSPDGQHVRCNFQLIQPSSGMAGGGSGQCQLPNQKTIDADFPKS
jgi:hypothetical protein